MTRRVGLRVKAFVAGQTDQAWGNFVVFDREDASDFAGELPRGTITSNAPTSARVAQAVTIVGGGVAASYLAELVGRPVKTCQRLVQVPSVDSVSRPGSSFRACLFDLTESGDPAFLPVRGTFTNSPWCRGVDAPSYRCNEVWVEGGRRSTLGRGLLGLGVGRRGDLNRYTEPCINTQYNMSFELDTSSTDPRFAPDWQSVKLHFALDPR